MITVSWGREHCSSHIGRSSVGGQAFRRVVYNWVVRSQGRGMLLGHLFPCQLIAELGSQLASRQSCEISQRHSAHTPSWERHNHNRYTRRALQCSHGMWRGAEPDAASTASTGSTQQAWQRTCPASANNS